MNWKNWGMVCALLHLAFTAKGASRYVNQNNSTPISPYTSWATAATNIQQAIDVAAFGDLVLVTNGVYDTGMRNHSGSTRVAIWKPVTVQSVNGPAHTIIRGFQTPGTTNGTEAIRCAYLVNGATLSGFTLESGAAPGSEFGGGVRCQSTAATLTNCVIARNGAIVGGGAFSGTLLNCSIISNAVVGFGSGGGASQSALVNCYIAGNRAGYRGGGVMGSQLTNCVLTGNYSASYGGGSDGSTLVNCTVVNNLANSSGGGAEGGQILNSIVYYNALQLSGAGSTNIAGGFVTNTCVAPLPFLGSNNFTNAPLFVDHSNGVFTLQPISPCRNSGNNSFITQTNDFAGKPRIAGSTVDLGAYESTFGGIVRYVSLNSPIPTAPFTNWTKAARSIQEAIDISGAGDFIYVSNGVYQTGERVVHGFMTNRVVVDKPLILHSLNGPETTVIRGMQDGGVLPARGIRCVYLASGAELHGFTLTNGAARHSGDEITECSGGGVWCEDDTAVISNCVLVGNAAARYGGGAFRGTLINCLLTNNTGSFGGGASSNLLLDCSLIRNSAAFHNLNSGGGAFGSTLSNCLLVANSAGGGGSRGGGAFASLLLSCVVSNNLAQNGGGLFFGSAENSLITSNRAFGYGGGVVSNLLNNCTVATNLAGTVGGGAYYSTLNDCLLITNKAPSAGGAYFGTLNRCELLGNMATATSGFGGGSEGSTLNDCILVGNSAAQGGGGMRAIFNRCLLLTNYASSSGGGSYSGSLSNCVLMGNVAPSGGGHYGYQLVNCTIVGNTATVAGGGVHAGSGGVARNCILYYNTAPTGSNHAGLKLSYCNTVPIFSEFGCFTNEPAFVDLPAGDLRLSINSPGINAGRNPDAPAGPDLDGHTRIAGGTVDIGAYEFQSPASVLSYAWAQQYGLPTDGSADYLDSDGDGVINLQEWRTRTDPGNPSSLLQLLAPSEAATGLFVQWKSVPGVTYLVQRATDFSTQTPFTTIRSNLYVNSSTGTINDPTATNAGPYFYRVGVQE